MGSVAGKFKAALIVAALGAAVAACGGSAQSHSSTQATARQGTGQGTAAVGTTGGHSPGGTTTTARGSGGASTQSADGGARTASTGARPGATTAPASGAPAGASPSAGGGGGAAPPASSHSQPLSVTEVAHITGVNGAAIVEQGVVHGTPIGSGTVVMQAHLSASGALVFFTVKGRGGSVSGQARVHLAVRGGTVYYTGTARLTTGTGSYSRVRASGLTVTGSGDVAGHRTVLQVTGREYV